MVFYNWANIYELLETNRIVPKDRRYSRVEPTHEQTEHIKKIKGIINGSPNLCFYMYIASLMQGTKYSLEHKDPEIFISCVDALKQKLEEGLEKLPEQEWQIHGKLENIIHQLQYLSDDYLKNKDFERIYQHGINYFNNYFGSIGKVLIKPEQEKELIEHCILILRKQEREYVEKEKYEKAARVRDGIKRLSKHY